MAIFDEDITRDIANGKYKELSKRILENKDLMVKVFALLPRRAYEKNVIKFLRFFATMHPRVAIEIAEKSIESESPIVKLGSLLLVEFASKHDASTALSMIDKLINYLSSEITELRLSSIFGLLNIAQAYPDKLIKALPIIKEKIHDSDEMIRLGAIKLLVILANKNLNIAEEVFNILAEALSSDESLLVKNAVAEWILDCIKILPKDFIITSEALSKMARGIEYLEASTRMRLIRAIIELAERSHDSLKLLSDVAKKMLKSNRRDHILTGAIIIGSIARRNPTMTLDVTSDLIDLLSDQDHVIRSSAIAGLSGISDAKPELLIKHVNNISVFLDDKDEYNILGALIILRNISKVNPKVILPLLPKLRRILEEGTSDTKFEAASIIKWVAVKYPEETRTFIPMLIRLLDEDDDLVKSSALWALESISREFPEDILPYINRITSLITDENEYIRSGAVWILTNIGERNPDVILGVKDTIYKLLKDTDDYARAGAVVLIDQLIKVYSEIVSEAAESISDLLDDESNMVKALTLKTMGSIIAKRPELSSKFLDKIVESLREKDPNIKASAAEALGIIGETDPSLIAEKIDYLVDLLMDKNETVRIAAAKALEKIRQRLEKERGSAA